MGAGCVGGWMPAGQPPLGGGMFSCVEICVTGGMYALQLTHVTSRLALRSSVSRHDEPSTTCCGRNESMVLVCRPRPTFVRSVCARLGLLPMGTALPVAAPALTCAPTFRSIWNCPR